MKKYLSNPWTVSIGSSLIIAVLGYSFLPTGPGIHNTAAVASSIQTVGQTGGTNVINNIAPQSKVSFIQDGESYIDNDNDRYKGKYITKFNFIVSGATVRRLTFNDKNTNDRVQWGHIIVPGGGESFQGVDANGNPYIQNAFGYYIVYAISEKPVNPIIVYSTQ